MKNEVSRFEKIYNKISGIKSDLNISVVNEALGLSNNVQKQTQPLQHLVNVSRLSPMLGGSIETTDDVGKGSLFAPLAHSFPYPLDAIEGPLKSTVIGIKDMIRILKECKDGLVTTAERKMCEEYIEFFNTLIEEVFKKRMSVDLSEIDGK